MELILSQNRLDRGRQTHFVRHFLQLKGASSLHTAQAYERDIKEFFGVHEVEAVQLQTVVEVGMHQVEHWLLDMKGRGLKPATINRKLSSLSSLYRWLLKYQDNRTGKTLIHFNPFAHLKEEKPRQEQSQTQFLTEAECQTLLDSFDIAKVLDLRNKAILSLALTTALRKSEIINLRLQDITRVSDFDVALVTRKGGKLDTVKLQPPVKALLDAYVEKTGRSYKAEPFAYLFVGHSRNQKNGDKLDPSALNYMIKAVCKRAGIEKPLSVHSTRHTAITLAILGGATIEKVRDFAAHQSIATTNRYVHSMDRLKDNAGDVITLTI